MSYAISIRPRVSETDMMGHINNVAVIAWLEEGRSYMIRQFVRQWDELPPFVLARIEVDYKEQIFFGREVQVRSWVERIGNSSATIAQEILQQESSCVRARCVLVHFDKATQRSAPLPEWLRGGLEAHLLTA
jgi:acyl-CoA thioester hydrolase